MNTVRLAMGAALVVGGALPCPGLAQPARPAPTRPVPTRPVPTRSAPPPTVSPNAVSPQAVPPVAAIPAVPQQTTAVFADWVLRCTYLEPTTKLCEVVQGVQRDNKPVAQIALGRPGKAASLQLTVLVPANVTFGPAPVLLPSREGEGEGPALAELTWRSRT